jgi:hypothetical protein
VSADEWEIRNEFSAVTLRRVKHGLGYRIAVESSLIGSTALLDATVLEALSQLQPDRLAQLVGAAMTAADEVVDGEPGEARRGE